MRESICTGCRANIVWFRTPRGKNMPADAKAETRIILDDDGAAVMAQTWMPHWATCPKADQFKRERKESP